jgi:hypothetical protein
MTRSLGPFTVGPLRAGTIALRAAAALLGAGCVAWALAPPMHKGFAKLALTPGGPSRRQARWPAAAGRLALSAG